MSAETQFKIIRAVHIGSIFSIIAMCIIASCNTQKHMVKTLQTSDSTAVQRISVHDSIAQTDSAKSFSVDRYFSLNKSAELSIGKITRTEEDVSEVAASLRFSIDSLHAHGDTLSTTSNDGTKISIYTDKKTGEQIASVVRVSGRKTTFQVEDVKLKSSTNIDTGSTLKAAITGSSDVRMQEVKKADSVKLGEVKKDEEKNIKRSTGFFAKAGIIAIAVLVLVIAFLAKKYWSKIKEWIEV